MLQQYCKFGNYNFSIDIKYTCRNVQWPRNKAIHHWLPNFQRNWRGGVIQFGVERIESWIPTAWVISSNWSKCEYLVSQELCCIKVALRQRTSQQRVVASMTIETRTMDQIREQIRGRFAAGFIDMSYQ